MRKVTSAILVFLLILSLSVPAFASTFDVDVGGMIFSLISRDDLTDDMLVAVNAKRAESSLPDLQWDYNMDRDAILRAAECALGGMTIPNNAANAEAESLADGALKTAQEAMDFLMADPVDEANILSSTFTSMAAGCIEQGEDELYWVLLFGTTANPSQPVYWTVTFDTDGGTTVDSQSVRDGEFIVMPEPPVKDGFVFGGWTKDPADDTKLWDYYGDTVTGDITLYAVWTEDTGSGGSAPGDVDGGFPGITPPSNPGGTGGTISSGKPSGSSGGGGGGGGSSGGGGGGGGGGSAIIAPLSTSSNVGTDGTVTSAAIKKEAEKALSGNNPTVKTKNAASISAATIKALADLASKQVKILTLTADTIFSEGNAVQGRLNIPLNNINIKNDLKLGVYTEMTNTASLRTRFEKWYSNKYAAVRLMHEGSFGGTINVVAKIDLKELNPNGLLIYSYNKEKNTYTQLTGANYLVDNKGYLHFNTDRGGDFIITDKELSKK